MTDKISTKELILMEAIQCFFELEYNKVTLNEIAKRAGVTKGGIYHYFNSKDDLFAQALQFALRDMAQMFEALLGQDLPFREQLRKYFDYQAMLGQYESIMPSEKSNPMLQVMYLIFLFARKKPEMQMEMAGLYRAITVMMKKRLEMAQEQGEVRKDLSAEVLALQLGAVFEGSMLYLAIDNELNAEQVGKDLFESYWAQIRA